MSFQKDFQPVPLENLQIIGGKNQFSNIMLIDNNVIDYQVLVDSANSSTFPIVYSFMSSKTDLLTLLQTNFTNISRICFVFNGSLGNTKMFLDCKPLFEKNETESYSENLQFIINIINEFSVQNIDFLACNTLNYSNWVNYYNILTQNTGVTLGASNNETGNINYGGDWIMENTSQDIESIYFSNGINYYEYLLDTANWFTGLNVNSTYQLGFAIDPINNFIYVAYLYANSITKISLTNPNTFTANWATQGISSPSGIVIDSTSTYMYVANGNSTITRILISNPNTFTANWATSTQGLSNCQAMVSDGTYLYVANNNNTISKILISNPNTFVANWVSNSATSVSGYGIDGYWPIGMVIDPTNTYLYVSRYFVNQVNRISLANPSISPILNWATQGISYPGAIVIDATNTYMYVTNASANTITRILISNPSTFTLNWATSAKGLNYPQGIVKDTGNLYVINGGNQTISKLTLQVICFKEDTKILTDNGYKSIQDLRKGDLIKTKNDGYKPIVMIGKNDIYHYAVKERDDMQLYKYSKDKFDEVFEDLIITGHHSVLVDNFTSEEQKEKVIEILGEIYVTDDKYRLPAVADYRNSVYETKGSHTIYHFALENDNYYYNYGVYANGLLVESCSKRYLKELSNMSLIE